MRSLLLFSLLLLCTLSNVNAQNSFGTVKGLVRSDAGTGLPGVSVTAVDTKTNFKAGAQTDSAGVFTFSRLPASGDYRFVFSSVGYAEQVLDGYAVRANATTSVMVKMAPAASNLDDIVVIGYQTVKRRDVVSAVSSLSGKDLKDLPINSSAEALAGRLAGVVASATEGSPGAAVTVQVRGGSSITQDNAPIYIVDGIQMENALTFIAPQEIASIDVLKDAASTAIYGARGANGVIVITTKGGANRPTQVSLDMFYGIRKIVNKLSVLKPYDYVQYQYQLYNTDSTTRASFINRYGDFNDIDNYKNMPFQDWQDAVFGRDARLFTQSLNISGGTKATTYSLTLSNSKEEGVMIGSGFRRTLASFKFDHKLSDKVSVGFNVRYSDQQTDGAGTSSTGTQGNNRLRNAVRYQPYLGGNVGVDIFDPDYLQQTNLTSPVLLANNEVRKNIDRNLLLNGYANFAISKELQFRSTVGITPATSRMNMFNGAVTGTARQNGNLPVLNMTNGESFSLTNSNTLTYNKKIGEDHSITVLAGQEIYMSSNKNFSATIKWMPADITPDEAFANIQRASPPLGNVQDAPTTKWNQNRLFSFFGRVNYTYSNKYIFTFSARRDGSSNFAPENNRQWATMPAVAVAWRLSREKFLENFLENIKANDLKLRFSYGAAGNNRIGQDLWRTVYANSSNANYPFAEALTPGMGPQSLENRMLRWETTVSRNLGFDFSWFNNKFTGSLDIYSNTTKNLLLNAVIPSTTGYTQQIQNIGSTRNRGIELQLKTTVITKRNFNWDINFNVSHNKNTVLDLGNNVDGSKRQFIYGYSGWITGSIADYLVQVGQPIGQFYGFVTDGRYELSDFTYDAASKKYTLNADVANNRVALGNVDPKPGDLKFKKLSSKSNMQIDDEDKTVLGNAQPKLTGGVNQQFTWKNFDMSLFLYFSLGNKVYNANKIENTTQYLYKDNNMSTEVLNRWRVIDDAGNRVTDPTALAELNKNTTFWTPPGGQFTLHSYAIENGSFLRVSNLTIGYNLPKNVVEKTKIFSRFRVYATVNNLYTFTGYSGFDPEANTRRSTPLTPGVDYAAYPRSRLVTAGVNITFK